jgi:ribosomal protein L40E
MTENKDHWTCRKCQADNDPDFSHCRLCGQAREAFDEKSEKTCSHCGHVCSGYFSCPKCGSEEFLQL